MKRFQRYIYCAIIALLAISCDKVLDDPMMSKPIVIPETISARTPLFDSNIPESKSGALYEYAPESWDDTETIDTRTYAVVDNSTIVNGEAGEYYQYWSADDAISVFLTTANLKYQFQYFETENGKPVQDYGHFQLVGSETQGNPLTTANYYSVYPYKSDTKISKTGEVTYTFPAEQHYNGDSYSNEENGMIAFEPIEGADNILYFQNFCSYLQLRLYTDPTTPKTVTQITLVANSTTDAISGQGTIKIVDGAPKVTMKRSASNQVILDCGSGVELSQDQDDPTKFWFVLPGGFKFTEGFSVTITFADNKFYKKATNKVIEIGRSHIKPMATFNPILTVPSSPIRYKYNGDDPLQPYPLNNTFYGENGVRLEIVDQVYDEETGEWVVYLSGTLKTIGGNSFPILEPDIEYIKIDSDGDFLKESNETSSITVSEFAFYNTTADSLIIYNNIDSIKESAFTGSTITDLKILGNVTSIKNSAGTGSSIKNIEISGNVSVVEEQAFSSCDKLEFFSVEQIDTIGYRAFYKCDNLTEITIPGVRYLSDGAFRSCSKLTEVNLDSVTYIGDNAFMDCSGLTSVRISSACTMIGEGAFCNATSLSTVYCYATYPPFIKTDNYNSSYVFDNVADSICIYIPNGSEGYYLDSERFIGQTFEDTSIEAEVNWWYEEYGDYLQEMAN